MKNAIHIVVSPIEVFQPRGNAQGNNRTEHENSGGPVKDIVVKIHNDHACTDGLFRRPKVTSSARPQLQTLCRMRHLATERSWKKTFFSLSR